jgi:hypothetical protein
MRGEIFLHTESLTRRLLSLNLHTQMLMTLENPLGITFIFAEGYVCRLGNESYLNLSL